jgi:hypothetical protein
MWKFLFKVGPPEDIVKRKYELTPYEKLMESIKHPPQLNSALVSHVNSH